MDIQPTWGDSMKCICGSEMVPDYGVDPSSFKSMATYACYNTGLGNMAVSKDFYLIMTSETIGWVPFTYDLVPKLKHLAPFTRGQLDRWVATETKVRLTAKDETKTTVDENLDSDWNV